MMSRLHAAIDFSELVSPVPGEGLEGLIRLVAQRMGLAPDWSGRGNDRGRDLVFTQQESKPLKFAIRWLVSCKDFATGGESVGENDLPRNLRDKMDEHNCQGFLLVTTTTPGTNAKQVLDKNDRAEGGRYFTDVWDRVRIVELLLQPSNEDLLRQFLPLSFARLRQLEGHCDDSVERVQEEFDRVTNPVSRKRLIPGIPDPLPRSEVGHVEDQLEAGKCVVLSGESGTGKSGIGYALCTVRAGDPISTLFLDAQRYGGIRSLRELSERLGLNDPIVRNIRRLAERGGFRLIVDQLDSTTSRESGLVFVDLAEQCAKVEGVQVVVISRRRESHERHLLTRLAATGFVELECLELTDEVVREVLERIGIEAPNEELVRLSKNLLNLSIIARIRMNTNRHDFDAIFDEVDLWEEYVQALETAEAEAPDGLVFRETLVAEAVRLARKGLQADDRTFILDGTKTPEQRRLESWRMIEQDEGFRYRFYHEKLQDFLYARNAVMRQLMPAAVLREIHEHRTRNVLPWMTQLYRHNNSSVYERFLEETFHV